METATTPVMKTAGKSAGLILFALVVITAALIAVTMVSDATANRLSAGTAQANATRTARCGMDEQTYMQFPASGRLGLEEQCNSPAEIQP
jgi:hypothetical protein